MKRKHPSKAALLFAACSAFLTSATAQVYQNDYTSFHVDRNGIQVVENQAIYRDEPPQQFYIAQMVGGTTGGQHLALNVTDKDMNPLNTWEYFYNQPTVYMNASDIDEMTGLEHMVVVGRYIDEGTITAPYVTSIDKNTGNMNWFHLFPELDRINAVKAGPDYSIVVGRRALPAGATLYAFTQQVAVIMKLDDKGKVLWERDFEDDKLMASSYTINLVYNDFLDVTQIDDGEFVAVGKTNNFLGGNVNDIWDADMLFVRFREDGSILGSNFLGNLGVITQGGSQSIQYEVGQSITYDPNEGKVVVAGLRLDHPQTYLSWSFCPAPNPYGVWVTKLDPYTLGIDWSKQYVVSNTGDGSNYFHGLVHTSVDWDGMGNYGMTYNFGYASSALYLEHTPVIAKVDANGGLMYNRHHYAYADDNSTTPVIFYDMVRAIDDNNIVGVGAFDPEAGFANPMKGWNVEAFDNIIDHCLMDDLEVDIRDRELEVGNVEYQNNMPLVIALGPDMVELPLDLEVHCEKNQVSRKMSDDGQKITTQVAQDESSRNIVITVSDKAANPSGKGKYNAVLINTMGQRILETESFSGSYKLDAAGLPSGIYYLQVYNGGFRQVHTISIR